MKGFEGYYKISNLGNVKRLERVETRTTKKGTTYTSVSKSKILKIGPNKYTGYYQLRFSIDGVTYRPYLHKMVYESFIGLEDSNNEVDHIDHDKSNNKLSNLEEVTKAENMNRMFDFYNLRQKVKYCKCGNVINCRKAEHCVPCSRVNSRKVKNRPTKEQLLKEISESSFVQVGKKYGVSDTTIRKWLK